MTNPIIRRYKGYTVTFREWGGMWNAFIESPEGKTYQTGYALELRYAEMHAQQLIDKLESEPPAEFGAGTGGK